MKKINKLEEVRHIITMHCNLDCLHCYLDGGGENNKCKILDISEEILNKFYTKYTPDIVSATGGEPLLNKKMVELLGKVINKYGGALEIVTNGTLITEDFVKKMNEINSNTFYQISLDGLEEYHNYLRNSNNAFKRVMNAIKIISSYNIRLKIRITVTDDNYKDLQGLINLLESFNNSNIELVIRPVVVSGRAKVNELKFSQDYSVLNCFKSDIIKISTTDNAGKCGCGINTVAIDSKGDIYPCNYTIGNLKYKMASLYDDNIELFENTEFKDYKGNCYARTLIKK